jgi:hypothetical protein
MFGVKFTLSATIISQQARCFLNSTCATNLKALVKNLFCFVSLAWIKFHPEHKSKHLDISNFKQCFRSGAARKTHKDTDNFLVTVGEVSINTQID